MKMSESNNVPKKNWIKRYNKLSPEVKQKIDSLCRYNKLQVIKRKRIQPQTGDIFLVSPRENLYFYGIVINAGIKNDFFDNIFAIAIFKDRIAKIEDADPNYKPDFDNLLIDIGLVGKMYWSSGFFYNVSRISDFSMPCSYGFYNFGHNRIEDEYGNALNKIPHLCGLAGIFTNIGVANGIEKEFIIDPSLLVI